MATPTIGVKVQLDGEKEYRDALSKITSQSKLLASEMKLVESEFDANTSAQKKAKAQAEVLQKQYEQQADKVKLITERYEKSVKATGENSDQTVRLKTALNKAQTELNNYSRQLKEAENVTEDVSDATEEAGDEIENAGKKAKNSEGGFTVLKGALSDLVADGFRKAIDATKEFAVSMIDVAAEVKAENSQFTQTFGDLESTAAEAIEGIADKTGILSTRLRSTGAGIYAFARSSGASTEEAMTLMSDALLAAADSAAYYDKSLDESADTLQSFLKGNFANDAALGVSATEFTRNAKAAELFGKKYAELTEVQKQQTLLKMVTDSQALSGAMGQAAREADGWENVQGNLNETWRQFKAEVGEPVLNGLIPIVQELTAKFTNWRKSIDFAKWGGTVGEFADSVLKFGEFMIGNGDAIASIAVGIGTGMLTWAIASKIMAVVEAVNAFKAANEGATIAQAILNGVMNANPIMLVVTIILTLVSTIVTFIATNEEARQKIIDTWNKIKSFFSGIGSSISNTFTNLKKAALTWGRDMLQNFINGVKEKIQALKNLVSSAAQTVKNFLGFSEPKMGPLSDFHTYGPDMIDLFIKTTKAELPRLNNFLASNLVSPKAYAVLPSGGAAYGYAGGGSSYNYSIPAINVYAAPGQNADDIANAVMFKIQNAVNKKGAVYG